MQPEVTESDLLDAIQHADINGDQGWTLADFDVKYLGELSMKQLGKFDDFSSWMDLEEGSLKGLSDAKILRELEGFRGSVWARRALGWLKSSQIPPIVVIDAPMTSDAPDVPLDTQIGDGRGRVNLAFALGLKLPVYRMTFRRPKKNPLMPANPAHIEQFIDFIDLHQKNDVAGMCARFEVTEDKAHEALDNAIESAIWRTGLTYEQASELYWKRLDEAFVRRAAARSSPAPRRTQKRNPSNTAALAESIEDVDGDFDEHFGDDPDEVLEQGEVRYGRKVIWVGSEGKMVEIDRHYVVAVQGNIFYPNKLAAVAQAVRDSTGPSESGKPVLYVGYGTVMLIDANTVAESNAGANEEDTIPLERPLDESDIGKLLYVVRNGNHRTFGALIGGETKVWMEIFPTQMQDVDEWRNRRKRPLPAYVSKNKRHMKLMKLLDEKLRND